MNGLRALGGFDPIFSLDDLVGIRWGDQENLIHPSKSGIKRFGLVQVAYNDLDARIFESLCLGFVTDQRANIGTQVSQVRY